MIKKILRLDFTLVITDNKNKTTMRGTYPMIPSGNYAVRLLVAGKTCPGYSRSDIGHGLSACTDR